MMAPEADLLQSLCRLFRLFRLSPTIRLLTLLQCNKREYVAVQVVFIG